MDDAALFFSETPWALPLYDALLRAMEARYPLLEVRVQKTQISFYNRRMFAAVSLPRRKADREAHRLLLTLGLNRRLDAPQILVATEPYPGRWTHHTFLAEPPQEALLQWLDEAYAFAINK